MSSTLAHAALPAPKAGRFKKSVSLPHETVEYLKSWMMSPAHVAHPYPTDQEKAAIMAETGIELKQLTNWFVNNRKRFWKPRVEAQLQHCPPPASAALQPTHPKLQRAPPFPLPLDGAAASAALYATARGSAPPGRPSNVAAVSGACPQDDPHTISEGSGSSACNSDDDASAAPSNGTCSTLGAAAVRRPDPRLAAAGPSAASAPGPPRHLPVDGYRRHEEVDVQVLRPERPDGAAIDAAEPLPGLRDVTIRAGVPQDRVVAAFKCPIAYTVPYDIEHDRKKVQSRRDGEVLRVKKHYLKLYLATRGVHSASSPVAVAVAPAVLPAVLPAVATASAPGATSLAATFGAVASASPARTRALSCTAVAQDRDGSGPPPPKRHRSNPEPRVKGADEWRRLCQNADSLFCESLPGLEDAVRMFGYVSR